MKKYTFEELPALMVLLLDEVKSLRTKVEKLGSKSVDQGEFLDVVGLIEFLPDHPSKSTIYRWVGENSIPHIKSKKHLFFSRQEIIAWLESGMRKPENL